MNNAQLIDKEEIDTIPILRERETEIVKIIEAIQIVSISDQWKALKVLIFDKLVDSLEKRISNEAKKTPLNQPEIYSLNGQLAWAKKFADFNKLSEAYRIELDNIRKKTNATN